MTKNFGNLTKSLKTDNYHGSIASKNTLKTMNCSMENYSMKKMTMMKKMTTMKKMKKTPCIGTQPPLQVLCSHLP